jgi:hypothetical protein
MTSTRSMGSSELPPQARRFNGAFVTPRVVAYAGRSGKGLSCIS